MYAIVESGGKQFKVSKGDVIEVEKLETAVGETVELKVLLTSENDKVCTGADVQNVKASAKVVSHNKAKKVVVYKYKPKKNVRKKQGHRQPFTRIKIESIG